MKYDIRTHPLVGTPHTVYVLYYKGKEVRRQISAFDDEDCADAIKKFKNKQPTSAPAPTGIKRTKVTHFKPKEASVKAHAAHKFRRVQKTLDTAVEWEEAA